MRGDLSLVVLLGHPVSHSVSPAIHNAALQAQGVDLVYRACDVAPPALEAAVAGLWALGGTGANVTVPHKETVLALAATSTKRAQAVGAANTLIRTEAGWLADNTDVDGFTAPLRPHANTVQGETAVVLGAGGAARAVVYGLARDVRPAQVTVVARRREQAEQLVEDIGPACEGVEINARSFGDAGGAVCGATLVVNATPLGMGDGRTPWSEDDDFHSRQVVYDLVYRPTLTPFLDAAQKRGATTIGGLPMLLAQAAGSYLQWTGRDMPLDVAERAARRALGLT